jgi:hypothetical protein
MKKILMILIILVLIFGCKKNVKIPNGLKKEGIDSFYLWNERVGEFVFINEAEVFFNNASYNFVLFNIFTQEYKIIKNPDNDKINSINGFFFDNIRNTICMLLTKNDNREKHYFYLFHLNDFSWEEISELTNMISRYYYNDSYYYDLKNNLLYFVSDKPRGEITLFDMDNKIILSKQIIPNFSNDDLIYNIGGNPVTVLLSYKKGERYNYGYCLYDVSSRCITNYFNLNTPEGRGPGLEDYIYLDRGKYLCLERTRRYDDKIIILDFFNNEKKTVIYDKFNEINGIFDLRKTIGNKYSFKAESTGLFKTNEPITIFV